MRELQHALHRHQELLCLHSGRQQASNQASQRQHVRQRKPYKTRPKHAACSLAIRAELTPSTRQASDAAARRKLSCRGLALAWQTRRHFQS